jgi:intein/homing endonuclease
MDREDIAWFAGLFEGEGTIVLPSANNSTSMAIFMTDRDVLERIHEITGTGSVRGPYYDKRGSNRKPIYKWATNKHADVVRLLLAIYPLMGERRRSRIADATNRLTDFHRGNLLKKNQCKKGHIGRMRPTSKGGRMCQECWNERQRERRAAEKRIERNAQIVQDWRNQYGV